MLAVVGPILKSRLEESESNWGGPLRLLSGSDIEKIGQAALSADFWAPLGPIASSIAEFIAAIRPVGTGALDLMTGLLDKDHLSIEHLYAGACRHYSLGLHPAAALGFLICYSNGRAKAPERPHLPSIFGIAVIAAHENKPKVACALAHWLVEQGFDHPRVYLLIGSCAMHSGDIGEARRALTAVARRARGNPNHSDDQHTAQRLLIGIQFGVTPKAPEYE